MLFSENAMVLKNPGEMYTYWENKRSITKMIYTLWKVRRFEQREEKRVAEKFYADPSFREIDSCLKRAYRWKNPYRASRKYWGEPCYGETPLTVLETLGRKLGIRSSDLFVDLGSGRGRGVFFMNRIFGCRALGIERVPLFIQKANEIKNNLCLEGIEFLEGDLSLLNGVEGTIFYVAWTCFSDELVHATTSYFEKLPTGVKVATLSEPIPSKKCPVIESFSAPFAWGEGEIYIHETI
jgi:SAM-dependent methyltransferase